MSDICPLCKGAGNLVTFARRVEYWDCSVCFGAGVTVQYGPPTIRIHAYRDKFAKRKSK